MKLARILVAVAMVAAIASTAVAQITTADPPVAITDNSGTLSACQTITVPATPETVVSAVVEIQAEHSWVGDLTFDLLAPSTTAVTLLNRPGRTGSGSGNSDDLIAGVPVTYDDAAASGASAETMGDAPCAGTIDGSADCPDNYIPAPDAADTPIPGNGIALADFVGEDPSGVWTLCAGDSAGGDTGTLSSWTLTIVETPVELQTFDID